MTTIIGIKVANRIESAVSVQSVLTKFGCHIKTRIGLHEAVNGHCSSSGLILLEIIDDEKAKDITNELCDIDEVEIQQMLF